MKRDEEKSKKKKNIILIIAFFIVTVGIFGIPKLIASFNDSEDESDFEGLSTNHLYRREAIKKEDGWYYFIENMEYELIATKEIVNDYYLNGCNLKYETLDYVYGTIRDIDGTLLYTFISFIFSFCGWNKD